MHSPIGQVALSVPATELTSVSVQWGAGDPASGTDQNAVPLALSIEASVDGGQEWQGITGGGEAVDVALAHKASLGSSQHRYPVSLLGLRRKRRVWCRCCSMTLRKPGWLARISGAPFERCCWLLTAEGEKLSAVLRDIHLDVKGKWC